LISVVATSAFSYFIWTANKKSAEISEKLASLEINRDTAIIKESSALLFLTALSGLEYIFFNYNHQKNTKSPKLSNQWVDNLDKLYGVLSLDEIKLFFDLYNDLYCMNRIINQETNDLSSKKIKEEIDSRIDTYFDNSCAEYAILQKTEFKSPIELLKREYQILFDKLHILSKSGSVMSIQTSYTSVTKYNTTGKTFCEIRYDNNIIHKSFWDISGKLLEDCNYINNKANGFKSIYDGNRLEFVGEVKDGKPYKGNEYHILLRNSDGYDLQADEAYFERQIEEQSSDEYWNTKSDIEDETFDNPRDWADYCNGKWEDGERILLTNEVSRETN
jgi:hypothetical protein